MKKIILFVSLFVVAMSGWAQRTKVVSWHSWNGSYSEKIINAKVLEMKASYSHELYLLADSTVIAFGSNAYGQCNVPVGLKSVKQIAVGEFHSLALKSDGSVVAWGENNLGQCSIPNNLKKVTQIDAAFYSNVALQTDSTVVYWGEYNSFTFPKYKNVKDVRIADSGGSYLFINYFFYDNTVIQHSRYDGFKTGRLIYSLSDVILKHDFGGGYPVSVFLTKIGNVYTHSNNGLKNLNLSNIKSIHINEDKEANVLFLKNDGTLQSWSQFGTLGPIIPSGLKKVYQIGGGSDNFYALIEIPENSNQISGVVYDDKKNPNCVQDSVENGISQAIVKASPGNYYTSTDANGKYTLYVDSGKVNYTLTQILANDKKRFFNQVCTTSHTVKLSGSNKDTASFNFANRVKLCSELAISVSNANRTRCFRSSTSVSYCNEGSADAANAVVKVTYPEYLIPISSTPTWTKREGNILYYELGTLAASKCGSIKIIDSVQCGNQNILGLSLCVKAEISPVSTCRINNVNYDGSRVEVSASCKNGLAVFEIQNPTNKAMSNPSEYRLYANDTLIAKKDFQLAAQAKLEIDYPANGKSLRLEADQVQFFPDSSRPRAFVEGCVVTLSNLISAKKGLVVNSLQDDAEVEKALSCAVIRGSYDPNDKLAQPVGLTAKHYVKAGTTINYTIRFQNTGTDKAYKVVLVDTLDSNLNLATLKVGSASHSYKLDVSGKGKAVLTFTFNAINLPTKTENEKASNGFVSYSIATLPNLADETVIQNKAGIYFDFNDPVITNSVIHTIGEPVLENFALGSELIEKPAQPLAISSSISSSEIRVYPNPTEGILYINGTQATDEIRFLDLTGRVEYKTHTTSESISIENLSKGFYLYEIRRQGEILQQGKVIVK